MRDRKTGEKVEINSNLLILLHKIQKEVGFDKTINVYSGYRSEKTNEDLRKKNKNSGVAKNSLHKKGKAIDIAVPGIKTKDLKKICLELNKNGGVGYYPKDGFIHLDIGKKRYWKG